MNQREQAINNHIQQDAFAEHLGAKVEIVAPGHSRVTLIVTDKLLNFHGTTHGGIVFSVGDIAFAAAGNSRGQTAVALNMTISFLPRHPSWRHFGGRSQRASSQRPHWRI